MFLCGIGRIGLKNWISCPVSSHAATATFKRRPSSWLDGVGSSVLFMSDFMKGSFSSAEGSVSRGDAQF